MQNLTSILDNKHFSKNISSRPLNLRYETAKEFGEYVGLSVFVVMRLFKLYGMSNVLKIRSWLYDIPYDNSRGGKIALATWKLKEMRAVSSKEDKETGLKIDSGGGSNLAKD